MANITARKRRDGSFGYTALIRIKKNGQRVHEEAKTFSSQTAAKEWAKRREVELEDHFGALYAGLPGAGHPGSAFPRSAARGDDASVRTGADHPGGRRAHAP